MGVLVVFYVGFGVWFVDWLDLCCWFGWGLLLYVGVGLGGFLA